MNKKYISYIFVAMWLILCGPTLQAQVRDNEVRSALQIIKQALQNVDNPQNAPMQPNGQPTQLSAIIASTQGDAVVVRLDFIGPVRYPDNFFISSPPRLVLDMPGVVNATGKTSQMANQGVLRGINIAQADNRTRVILNLLRNQDYTARIEGNSLLVFLTTGRGEDISNRPSPFSDTAAIGGGAVRGINFARLPDGAGRVMIELGDNNVNGDVKRSSQGLTVDFANLGLPEKLRRILDVTSFGTPVSSVTATPQGNGTRITINPVGSWEHVAYQTNGKFVVEVRPVVVDNSKLSPVIAGKHLYRGHKVSVNFQNGDVRGLLRLMSDELGLNAVISDAVQGNITLTLHDVPADQVVDIIAQQKNLEIRKSDNVLFVGTLEEFNKRDKELVDTSLSKESAEPLRSEYFQINYHVADDVKALISSNILSKRGTAVVDKRNNLLYVQDTEANLQKIRALVSKVDIPTRQVMIEARIVEANDSFSKVIGARLGINDQSTKSKGYVIGANAEATGYVTGQTTDPGYSKTFGVNLPGTPASGSAGSIALTLFNSGMSRFLNMELTALQNDGRGKIISSPRVMTANQVEALIEQGTNIPYQSATSSGATSTSFQKANLILRVKPQITPDGRVAMDLDINKDSPSVAVTSSAGVAIDTKHIKTNVLVDNGGTVVIGGIFTETESAAINKVPVLGDLPILGFLFRNKENKDNKTELLVFITPRIVDDNLIVK